MDFIGNLLSYVGLAGEKKTVEVPKEHFQPVHEEIKIDGEGFTESFDFTDVEGYRAFFERYGFVVVRDVLSPEQVANSIDEIWTRELKTCKRDRPNTWRKWPSLASKGLLGGYIADGPVAWNNRFNPRLHEVYANVIGTPELHVAVDRYGVMRPTKNVNFGEPTEEEVKFLEKYGLEPYAGVRDMPEWETQEKWIHWDQNPWAWEKVIPELDDIDVWSEEVAFGAFMTEMNATGPSFFKGRHKVQGLVALIDGHEHDGGFLTVPGFHKFLHQYCVQTPVYSKSDFVSVQREDPEIYPYAYKVTMRAGSVVIWDSAMPHCNYPSSGPNFRFCQYIKMFPARPLNADRQRLLKIFLPEDYPLTDLAKKLAGLESWA